MASYNALITGTKGGIGYALMAAYAARPNTTVIAAIRDAPQSDKAQAMVASITKFGPGSRIIPVQYDASSPDAAQAVVDFLQQSHADIEHLDLVVANAGIDGPWVPFTAASAATLQEQFHVNTVGPIMLYQATRDLLLASKEETPRYVAISSVVGSVQRGPHIGFELPGYGVTKAGLNWFIRKANLQEERLMLTAVCPGWHQTGMGNRAARSMGKEKAPWKIEEHIAELIDTFYISKEDSKTSLFRSLGEKTHPW